MMMSAAFAVTVSARRRGSTAGTVGFGLVTLIFVYAFLDNVVEKPDGIVISLAFIAGIVLISFVSAQPRPPSCGPTASSSTPRRCGWSTRPTTQGSCVIANKIQAGDVDEYREKEAEQRGAQPDPRERPHPVPGDRGERPVGVREEAARAR